MIFPSMRCERSSRQLHLNVFRRIQGPAALVDVPGARGVAYVREARRVRSSSSHPVVCGPPIMAAFFVKIVW